MACSRNAKNYNMGHRKRGKCLVFNQATFENQIYNRPGSDVDARRIDITFSKLGFRVMIHNNLTYSKIMKEIEKCEKNSFKAMPYSSSSNMQTYDHTDNDCVCVFVLSHGDSRDRLMTSDHLLYSSEKIWKPFTAKNCPTLAGKPKLFFFQACRGSEVDQGFSIPGPAGGLQTDAGAAYLYKIPTMADFLIGRSSPSGWISIREPDKGSWYIQSLCDVIDESAKSTDLMRMHTMTARKVAIDFQKHDANMKVLKQMPSVTSTLTRDLYFSSRK